MTTILEAQDPFLLSLDTQESLSISDMWSLLHRCIQHERRVKGWLKGTVSDEELFDGLSDYGLDSYDWLDNCEHAVDEIIATRTPINDPVLFLPERYVKDGVWQSHNLQLAS